MADKQNDTGAGARFYANHKKAAVEFDPTTREFHLVWEGRGRFVSRGRVSLIRFANIDGLTVTPDEYGSVVVTTEDASHERRLIVDYSDGPAVAPEFRYVFVLAHGRISMLFPFREDADVFVEGDLAWGDAADGSTFACRLDGLARELRTGFGPATSTIDNALFDRTTDSAVEVRSYRDLRIEYDWQRGSYRFVANAGSHTHSRKIVFAIHEEYFRRKFQIPYRPMNRSTTFPTPPAGWMTWYALKFATSEETVLRNADWMARHLKRFGAETIWVDWEWYHSRNYSEDEHPDIGVFSPDPRRYPKGLAHVAGRIKELGLTPAIWIGATNEPNKNELLAANPEWILAEDPMWCGRWWIDPSHPGVASEYIPAAFRQIGEWGYEAVKWDCFPAALQIADTYHDRFHDQSLTSEQALRQVVAAARRTIGDDMYMMSCSGHGMRDITFAADLFDGARIGGDVFDWDDFVRAALRRAFTYLCFHGIIFNADFDNVVIRSEYNTMRQAESRVSFIGLTGTPVTLGDDLPALEAERVELLKRALPVVDFHPMDLHQRTNDDPGVVINARIATPFESWNVVTAINTTDFPTTSRIDLRTNLQLATRDGERYLVYDFWGETFIGVIDGAIELELDAYGSRLLAIRRYLDRPQILSTSRHITQGAHDLMDMAWDAEALVLSGLSRVVEDDPYVVTLHVPSGYAPRKPHAGTLTEVEPRVWTLAFQPERGGEQAWSIGFARE